MEYFCRKLSCESLSFVVVDGTAENALPDNSVMHGPMETVCDSFSKSHELFYIPSIFILYAYFRYRVGCS